MKTILLLLVFLISVTNLSAQDTTLPRGKSRILLYSGKELNDIRLWKMDISTIEYVIKGNLMDVKTAEVRSIETPESLISFDTNQRVIVRKYDLIIPYVGLGDTIRCFIQNDDRTTISYLPVGKRTVRMIAKNSVRSYARYFTETQAEQTNVIAPPAHEDSVSGQDANIIFPEDTVKYRSISAIGSDGYRERKVMGLGRGRERNIVLITFGALLLLFL